MINNIEAQQFTLVFKGKNNTYVRNELPLEKPNKGIKSKTKITSHEGTVDKSLLLQHLEGEFAVGICPVTADGKCFFGVIDIDNYNDSLLETVLDSLRDYQIPLVPFRSKSGGLHLYLFVSRAIQAKKMRDILSKVVFYLNLEDIFGSNKVEIFPKQDKATGFGSAVTLPYFNAEETYTYMLDFDGSPVEFKDFLALSNTRITSIDAVKEALDNLPYNDAPPCIQRLILSKTVGTEDSGRNNFLFSYAVYAKKKNKEGFESSVHSLNETFACPLDESDVDQICNSVKSNEYMYRCKDIPCSSVCDKTLCKNREYGIGKEKGHFTGVQYGELRRYLTAEPYYIWKLRLNGQEHWKDVVFKDEGLLLDQKNFAKMCIRYLNQAPMQVSNNAWYEILNTVLPNIIDVEVKQETDTSGLSMLKNYFVTYLANKQARRDSPYQIKVGLCVRKVESDEAKYYFTHHGFATYLKNQKISFEYNMLRETLKSFGCEEDTLVYTNALGETKSFPCWSKIEDSQLDEAYSGAMEVEQGDKGTLNIDSVSEALNIEVKEEEEKSYSKEDFENAKQMF